MTREEWLLALTERLRPRFTELGHPLPAKVRVSIGFPAGGGPHATVIAECWAAEASPDRVCQIHIAPTEDDPLNIAGSLAHELAHAALGSGEGHGRKFAALCKGLGMVGPARSMGSGEAFTRYVSPHLAELGPLPHVRLGCFYAPEKPPAEDDDEGGTEATPPRPIGRPPKQGTRMLKAVCPDCGYTVRLTRKWLATGAPLCGNGECSRRGEALDAETPAEEAAPDEGAGA